MLSEHFWDDLNSVFAKDVGEAWIAADPQNADPYALLGAHYAALDDESGIEKLLQNAEQMASISTPSMPRSKRTRMELAR